MAYRVDYHGVLFRHLYNQLFCFFYLISLTLIKEVGLGIVLQLLCCFIPPFLLSNPKMHVINICIFSDCIIC